MHSLPARIRDPFRETNFVRLDTVVDDEDLTDHESEAKELDEEGINSQVEFMLKNRMPMSIFFCRRNHYLII